MSLALFALLLALAEPPAPAPDAPAAQRRVEADAPVGPAAEDPGERLPAGAPSDDYAFVAWCDGVLAGHMDLAERVHDILPVDPVLKKIGKAYLDSYEKALAASPQAATAEGRERAEAARKTGWNNWDKAREANKQLAADTYLAWQVPGRCEHAAVRLSGDKDLFRLNPTLQEVMNAGESAPVSGSQAVASQAADAAATPASASSEDLKIKTLPDPVPAQSDEEKKEAEIQARKDRLQEQTMHPTPEGPTGPQ